MMQPYSRLSRKWSFLRSLSFSFVVVQAVSSLEPGRPSGALFELQASRAAKKGGAIKSNDASRDAGASAEPKPDVSEQSAAPERSGAKANAQDQESPGEEQALRTSGPAQLKAPRLEKSFDNSARADQKRDEAIAEIQRVLPKVTGQQKGELVFRLAELYWQKSKYIYNIEFKKFDEEYQKWVDQGRQGKEPAVSEATKKSDAYKKQALANYRVVLEEYPDYPRLDEVLYIMAFNEYEAGKKKEAIDNYSKLIRQYPKSEYISDAYLALGEHYFGSNDLTKATKAYNKAYVIGREQKRPSVFRYALYKLAWCDYNAQAYEDALKRFKQVVEESERVASGGEGKEGKRDAVLLKSEALNDMVLTYSQLDETKQAYDYFKGKAGGQKAFQLTSKLGAVYGQQGKYAAQIETLRELLRINPDSPQAPDFQSSIVAAFSQLGDRDAVRKEVTKMVEFYRPGSPWWQKNENNANAVERARAVAENRMRELVTEYHRYAQKFKKVDDYTVARDIYAKYLQAFPDSESAYRLNFYYAELLWDLGDWRNAALQYDEVVKRDPKGEYTRVCAYNAVLAWEKIVKKEPPPQLQGGVVKDTSGKKKDEKIAKERVVIEDIQKGRSYSAQPIPDDEKRLADACDRYVQVVPEAMSKGNAALSDELIKVKFKAAYIYQSHYHFDGAAQRFGELIERWPSSEYARTGADLILDSYDAREDWTNLEKWARAFAGNRPLMGDDKFAKSVAKFMEGASFKSISALNDQAAELNKKGKKEESTALAAQAAGRFEAFVNEFPKSEFAPTALYNSTLIYSSADQLDLAIKAANRLLSDYATPLSQGDNLKNKLEEKTFLNLAAYEEKTANYQRAVETYVRFVDKFKTSEKAPDALYNAAIFQLGLGDAEKATSLLARYIKDYSTQKDVADVYMRMALIYEEKEDWKRAVSLYGDFERLYGKVAKSEQLLDARYKHAHALDKAGRSKEMREVCSGVLEVWKKAEEKLKKAAAGQTAGGYCAFQILEDEWQAYKAIKIEAKPGMAPKKVLLAVKDALELKLRRRDEIAKKYLAVLEYGSGEWGVAGLTRAADALLDYVKTLRDAPDPPALANNPEALDLFRTELENIAFPVEDQGIQALEQALKKAFELGIYSTYTLEIEGKLRAFRPARFGRIYEMPFFPSLASTQGSRTAQR